MAAAPDRLQGLSIAERSSVATIASYPNRASTPSGLTKDASTTIAYDGASQTYTLKVFEQSAGSLPVATLTFGPTEIDASRTTSALTVYTRSNATDRQTLTISNPGTSGQFTYRYVGSALFADERAKAGAAYDVAFSATVFGFATDEYSADLSARSPTTGTARYGIDVIGFGTGNGGLVDIRGTGNMYIDFGKGAFSVNATSNGLTGPGARLDVGGVITRAGRVPLQNIALTGDTTFTDGGSTLSGGFNGNLYGPGGAEVGATWSASDATRTISGTIMGRKEADVASPTRFDDAANPAQFYNAGNDSRAQIFYDPQTGRYQLIRAEYSLGGLQSVRTDTVSGSAAFGPSLSGDVVFHKGSGAPLEFVRSVEVRRDPATCCDTRDFLFGYASAAAGVPRSGIASYALDVYGGIGSDVGLSGSATLRADLSSGTFRFGGNILATQAGTASETGTLFGQGQISSTTNFLTGEIAYDFTTRGSFTGYVSGQYYGPAAEELGLVHYSNGSGDIHGTMIGRRTGYDPNPVVPPVGGSAYQSVGAATWLHSPALGTPANFMVGTVAPTGSQALAVAWSPSTAQFTVTPANPNGDPATPFTIGAGERDAAASNADFDVYRTANAGTSYEVRVLRADNTKIAMTYAGFAGVSARLAGGDPASTADDHDDYGFAILDYRNATAAAPLTGAAAYAGQVFGNGIQLRDNNAKAYYSLSGASSFQMNFSDASFKGSMAISGTDGANGQVTDFGNYAWSGAIAGNGFAASGNGGQLSGTFFGPQAQEVGGVFSTDQMGPGTRTILQGGFLAK